MTHVAGMSGPTRRELDLKHVTVTGKDGHAYLLRPIEPGDAPSLMRGYDAMSDQAKWFRMLHTLPHLTEEMARRFCSPDHDRDLCIVIIGHGALDGEILGGARIVGELNGQSAEFSVSLRPEAQGLGLARAALQMVLSSAREMGYDRVWGLISVQNTSMLALARRLGFTLLPDVDDAALVNAEIQFRNSSPEP